jgi:hypothetical protein
MDTIYTHMSCHGLFHVRHKEFGNLLTKDCITGINRRTVMIDTMFMTRNQNYPNSKASSGWSTLHRTTPEPLPGLR